MSAAVGGERTLKPFLRQTQEQFQAAYDKLWGYCNGAVSALIRRMMGPLAVATTARKLAVGQSPLSCVGASVENQRCLRWN